MRLRVEVYRSRNPFSSERWRWRARAANGRIVAESGEGYAQPAYAEEIALRLLDSPHHELTLVRL